MSVDGEGFFILKTLDPFSEGHEYRLAYAKDISVIFGKYNDKVYNWEVNSEGLWKIFKACFFSTNLDVVKKRAEQMSAKHGKETDCGIMVINNFQKKTWDELINGS